MRFDYRWLQIVLPAVLLAGLAALPLPAQNPATPAALASAGTDAQQYNAPQQAYTLPPDRLAKAIAINRIRNILNIVGSLWGILFVWLLLAFRGWSSLEGWAVRYRAGAGYRGCSFSPPSPSPASWRPCRWDMTGEHFERSYGISVQGWGGWFGDQGKALALALLFRRSDLPALQLDCAPLAQALLAGPLGGDPADPCRCRVCFAVVRPPLLQSRAKRSRRIMPPW